MKILKDQHKKGTVQFLIDSLDDLWILSKVICVGDSLSGNTQRKLKLGGETDRNAKIMKKWMHLQILVEKVEYEPNLKTLRVSGPITVGNDDVANGDYHSFTLEEESVATIHKVIWHDFEYQRLLHSQKSLLIILCDRESALVGKMTAQGYQKVTTLLTSGVKKGDLSGTQVVSGENFFSEVANYMNKTVADQRIIGCSHFWQSELKKSLSVPVTFIEVTDVSEASIKTLLSSKEFHAAIKDNVIAEQIKLFEQILVNISTSNKATFGLSHVESSSSSGAISDVMVSNKFITELRLHQKFETLQTILQNIEQSGGIVHIVDEENPIHKNLVGLGGIAALLRYSVE
jgi:protein pelota